MWSYGRFLSSLGFAFFFFQKSVGIRALVCLLVLTSCFSTFVLFGYLFVLLSLDFSRLVSSLENLLSTAIRGRRWNGASHFFIAVCAFPNYRRLFVSLVSYYDFINRDCLFVSHAPRPEYSHKNYMNYNTVWLMTQVYF